MLTEEQKKWRQVAFDLGSVFDRVCKLTGNEWSHESRESLALMLTAQEWAAEKVGVPWNQLVYME